MTALGRLAECRLCHAPIRFVLLTSGKPIPVNPAPGPDGNVVAEPLSYGQYARLEGWVVSAEHPARPGMLRFTPHYATCEEAGRTARKDRPASPPDPELDLFSTTPTTEETP